MNIATLDTIIVDIPTKRVHKLSFGDIHHQSYVIVRARTSEGIEGIGEASTIGGPSWSEESPEGIKATIDRYLAPHVLGQDPRRIEWLAAQMDRAVKGNSFAKAAIEMALFDITARSLAIPVYQLLGGKVVDRIPLAWTLATGDIARDIEEVEEKLATNMHRIFKIKIGALEPREDVSRVAAIAAAVGARASIRVDVNQAWNEITAAQWLPALEDAGVALVEQPIPRWNIDGMARLCAAHRVPIMADESLCSTHDAIALAKASAADVFALKVTKAGGLLNTRKVAAIADGAGIPCYGGCMLETSVGTAAYAHVFATLTDLSFGCELFGPLLLKDDITRTGLGFGEGAIQIPDGPGFGVELDEDKLNFYRRDRATSKVYMPGSA